MISECCECDKIAIIYHGPYAYCAKHLTDAVSENKTAHECIQCGEEQPHNVSWRRDAPCGKCQG